MNTQLSQYLRISPYQTSYILKYQPDALLAEADMKSSAEILYSQTKLNHISNLTFFQQQQTNFVEQTCYFCKAKSSPENLFRNCGDCRKIVCLGCQHRCAKCDKVLCQFDKTYDYSCECVCCFNC